MTVTQGDVAHGRSLDGGQEGFTGEECLGRVAAESLQLTVPHEDSSRCVGGQILDDRFQRIGALVPGQQRYSNDLDAICHPDGIGAVQQCGVGWQLDALPDVSWFQGVVVSRQQVHRQLDGLDGLEGPGHDGGGDILRLEDVTGHDDELTLTLPGEPTNGADRVDTCLGETRLGIVAVIARRQVVAHLPQLPVGGVQKTGHRRLPLKDPAGKDSTAQSL